ncbi:MAG: hypothetical protein ABIG63_04620 [Chloroflexota bacterium]
MKREEWFSHVSRSTFHAIRHPPFAIRTRVLSKQLMKRLVESLAGWITSLLVP